MPKISVLMSVFNEKLDYVKLSVLSILNQTYKDFELIIINDNPNLEKNVSDYLNFLTEQNNAITIVNNKKNVGLAESMNIAFSHSSGKYIARMDSDDISSLDRFEKQIKILEDNHYDLVCSYFEVINENSEIIIKHYSPKYNNSNIDIYLPYTNTIHHPTVMMTRKMFEKAGKYRNFPCAQDYDLWLRFLDNNAKFYVIKENLLKYRIRNNSVTRKKHFIQKLTLRYIQNLYKMRKRLGYDNYSIENYNEYLIKNHINDEKYVTRCIQEKELNDKYVKLRNKGSFIKYLLKIKIFIKSDFYRKIFLSNFENLLTIYLEIIKNYFKREWIYYFYDKN